MGLCNSKAAPRKHHAVVIGYVALDGNDVNTYDKPLKAASTDDKALNSLNQKTAAFKMLPHDQQVASGEAWRAIVVDFVEWFGVEKCLKCSDDLERTIQGIGFNSDGPLIYALKLGAQSYAIFLESPLGVGEWQQ
jgi:hypothetical protein